MFWLRTSGVQLWIRLTPNRLVLKPFTCACSSTSADFSTKSTAAAADNGKFEASEVPLYPDSECFKIWTDSPVSEFFKKTLCLMMFFTPALFTYLFQGSTSFSSHFGIRKPLETFTGD